MLTLTPLTRREAGAYIREVHRHHGPPQGFKFAIGVRRGEQLVGVATAGRPVARSLQDGHTIEVTRVATDGTPNACSMLYGACWHRVDIPTGTGQGEGWQARTEVLWSNRPLGGQGDLLTLVGAADATALDASGGAA